MIVRVQNIIYDELSVSWTRGKSKGVMRNIREQRVWDGTDETKKE
jgi:hypothetical protein